jgi:hypothetical protein
MDKAPKYEFVPEFDLDTNANCPIKILEGEYSGIVYRYGKISLKEENDNLNVTMDIEIIKSPDNFDSQDKSFTNVVGEIFSAIIVEKMAEPIDLEDDVHQD